MIYHRIMNQRRPIPYIRELCKGQSEFEIIEAENTFRELINIIEQVVRDIGREKKIDRQ